VDSEGKNIILDSPRGRASHRKAQSSKLKAQSSKLKAQSSKQKVGYIFTLNFQFFTF
jgi:hypothetical protein